MWPLMIEAAVVLLTFAVAIGVCSVLALVGSEVLRGMSLEDPRVEYVPGSGDWEEELTASLELVEELRIIDDKHLAGIYGSGEGAQISRRAHLPDGRIVDITVQAIIWADLSDAVAATSQSFSGVDGEA